MERVQFQFSITLYNWLKIIFINFILHCTDRIVSNFDKESTRAKKPKCYYSDGQNVGESTYTYNGFTYHGTRLIDVILGCVAREGLTRGGTALPLARFGPNKSNWSHNCPERVRSIRRMEEPRILLISITIMGKTVSNLTGIR